MSASRTARERARAELTDEIKAAARRQLAEVGAGQLSLRAVARELGMVSSAVYRYFPSRDDLLTALIIDSYNAIGAATEAASAATEAASADAKAGGPRARWIAACAAIRDWALRHPHEYALLYGTPVPGYRAPQDTVGPGIRVQLALVETVHAAWLAGELREPSQEVSMPLNLLEQVHAVSAFAAPGVPEDVMVRVIAAWSQLFGMLTFELFGQYTGMFEPADEFFAFAVEQLADHIGLGISQPT